MGWGGARGLALSRARLWPAGQDDGWAGWDRKQRRADSSGRARHDPAFVYGGEGGKGRSAEGGRPQPSPRGRPVGRGLTLDIIFFS